MKQESRMNRLWDSPFSIFFVLALTIGLSLINVFVIVSERNHLARFCSDCKAFHLEEEMTCEENRKQVEEKIGYWKEKFDKGQISEAKFHLETIDYLENLPRTKW